MVLNPKIFNGIKKRFSDMEVITPREFAQTILDVINDYEAVFSQPPFSDWGLLAYKDLDLNEYPINHSVFHKNYLGFSRYIDSRLDQMISIPFKHRSSFAMLLRSHLEDLLYVELKAHTCPNCHSDGGGEVILVKYSNHDALAFFCQSCNHSNFLEDEPLGHLETMIPPTTSELIEYGYLTSL
ncbi:hypothetical protein PSAR109036_08255 [Psychrobacter arenosus]|uniref:hypothetical protein n=1 Tax=Psychrobacter arenosus TaxID=256326 RepID=UPI001918FA6F|nr:hypothetical protein [Psychrobacter arenosus]